MLILYLDCVQWCSYGDGGHQAHHQWAGAGLLSSCGGSGAGGQWVGCALYEQQEVWGQCIEITNFTILPIPFLMFLSHSAPLIGGLQRLPTSASAGCVCGSQDSGPPSGVCPSLQLRWWHSVFETASPAGTSTFFPLMTWFLPFMFKY